MIDTTKDYSVIYNESALRQKCTNVETLEEGQEISRILFKVLANHKNGVGLSAIQIGIPKKVFVINVKEPIYFVNAEIVEQNFPIITDEGCLSFPNKYIKTKRFAQIKVKADNIKGEIIFGYQGNLEEDFKNNPNMEINQLDLLESVAIQHEYSHQLGKLMFDYQFHQPNYLVNKIGRNEKICVTDKLGNDILIKYKKAIPFLETGEWKLKDVNF